MTQPKLSVAIVGGGIGGVNLAIALSKYPDIDFQLYEAAAAFEEIGAGVGVFAIYINTPFPNLERSWGYRKADKASGAYHRAQFLERLVSLLPKRVQDECVHFKKRLSHYEQGNGSVVLHFTDGTTASCDILIGADGIKNPTRYGIFAEKAALEANEAEKERLMNWAVPRWTGLVAYRGLISAPDVEPSPGTSHRAANDWLMYCGKKAHLVVFPIMLGKVINAVVFVNKAHSIDPNLARKDWPTPVWVEQAPAEEMLE
ncbi:hypothetical protein C8J56DRAFT_1048574 [Mycena floridula]|nr:hypothetical protein C8J56DRAFT_1048574 [Mycena floridula]